jgi:hypothetical protein
VPPLDLYSVMLTVPNVGKDTLKTNNLPYVKIKELEWCCAWAGKTPGGIGFALIFLVLFASRQKERKAEKRRRFPITTSSQNLPLIKAKKIKVNHKNNYPFHPVNLSACQQKAPSNI